MSAASASWTKIEMEAKRQQRREKSRINRVIGSKFYKKHNRFDVEALKGLCRQTGIPVPKHNGEASQGQAERFQLVQEIISRRCMCKQIITLSALKHLRCDQCKLTSLHFTCVESPEQLVEYKENGWVCQGCVVDNFVCFKCGSGEDDVMECENCQLYYSCLKCDNRKHPVGPGKQWFCRHCRAESKKTGVVIKAPAVAQYPGSVTPGLAQPSRSSARKRKRTAEESLDFEERMQEESALRIGVKKHVVSHRAVVQAHMSWSGQVQTAQYKLDKVNAQIYIQ
jgi:hypothetical protein